MVSLEDRPQGLWGIAPPVLGARTATAVLTFAALAPAAKKLQIAG